MMYHCQVDIDYIMNARTENVSAMLRDSETGRLLTGVEVKVHAAVLKAKGYEVIPIGCDHHDAKGYCRGHAR